MRIIPMTELNQQTSRVIHDVHRTGEEIAITLHGEVMARIVPAGPADLVADPLERLVAEGLADRPAAPSSGWDDLVALPSRSGLSTEELLAETRGDH